VAVDSEETRDRAIAVAASLRSRGIPVEVAPKADRFGRQIRYADRRGIPYVWFSSGEVKDIRSGEQIAADPAVWMPPEADLRPQVTAASPRG
jgi:histidyl-tRNA synthetase